jgi:hypothetical protein
MALWIMTDFLPLINADKIYFYRICNITHETVNNATAAAVVVYSPPVAVAAEAVDTHECFVDMGGWFHVCFYNVAS